MSDSAGSVTEWIRKLKKSDPRAQQFIWNRFVKRLIHHANRKLGGLNQAMADAEDVAIMAFQNFFSKSPESFEKLVNRNDLWKLLTLLAERRAIDILRRWYNERNGDKYLVNESALSKDDDPAAGLDNFSADGKPPDIELILAEEVEIRLQSLNDEVMQSIALEKLQGARNKEISDRLAIALRTVERKLCRIREIFGNAVQ